MSAPPIRATLQQRGPTTPRMMHGLMRRMIDSRHIVPVHYHAGQSMECRALHDIVLYPSFFQCQMRGVQIIFTHEQDWKTV